MKSINKNNYFYKFCNESNLVLPLNFSDLSIYKQIEGYRDFEYIYCIAYEMLIRTDKYNLLLKEYDDLNNNKNISKKERVKKLDSLITDMRELGLNQNSFIGFDCGNGNVFQKIKLYEEIQNSPWSVRTLDKFILQSTSDYETVLDQLIYFYFDKKELYEIEDENAVNKKYVKTNIHPRVRFGIDNKTYIPCKDSETKQIIYKSLTDTIYLKELDNDFLNTLKEKKEKKLLRQMKVNFKVTSSFWYKYNLNDIKYGIDKLITHYINNKKIKRINRSDSSKITLFEVLSNISNFSIPCIDRQNNDNQTIFMQISKNMELDLLENDFLSTLEFNDLKGNYIETEPQFNRPRLIFDEARLINLPINLNLSKNELLLYILEVKKEFDKDNYIVKNPIENYFNLALESEYLKMPTNIKYVGDNEKTKRYIANERKKFKKGIATAFYIYDLYKYFHPYFKEEINDLREVRENDIKNKKESYKKKGDEIDQEKIDYIQKIVKANIKEHENSKLINNISYLTNFTNEHVLFHLTAMKEFIHGINGVDENNPLKKKHSEDKKNKDILEPKYKNLIIGNSNIMKINNSDMKNILEI